MMQTAHADERGVVAAFDGEQAQPLARVTLLSPRRHLIGVLGGPRNSPEMAHHLGVGVEGCVVWQIAASECPQYRAGSRQDRGSIPLRHAISSSSGLVALVFTRPERSFYTSEIVRSVRWP